MIVPNKHPNQATDIETAYELMQQLPSRQSDKPSALGNNDHPTEIVPQNKPTHSRVGNYNVRPNPNSNYSEIYR